MKRIRFFRRLAFCVSFFLIVFILTHLFNGSRFYINDIRSEYKGVIIDKYFNKATHLEIKTDQGKTIDVSTLSDSLINISSIGDSIEKTANDNYVILKKGDKTLKVMYIYIPKEIRDDKRWPKEWKDKWIQK